MQNEEKKKKRMVEKGDSGVEEGGKWTKKEKKDKKHSK